MKHYLTAASAAEIQAQIAAQRANLSQLRAQRPFRQLTTPAVVDVPAVRFATFPLVGVAK